MKLQLMTRRVHSNIAGQWVRQALQLLRTHPSLIGITSLLYLMLALMSIIPAGPLLTILLMPVLMAGYYQCIVDALSQKTPLASTLFVVFQRPAARNPLFMLGVVRLVLATPMMLLPPAVTITPDFQQFSYEPISLLVLIACFLVYSMLFAYAEPIIYFLGERKVTPVLRASLDACWKNVLPLSMLGVILMAGMLLAVLLVSAVTAVVQPLGVILFFVAILFMAPTALIAFFLSFRDCFVLTPPPADAEKTVDTFEV